MPGQIKYDLQRFLDAQEGNYSTALAEIRSGKKRSHWMWFIFPQIKGLGRSETSKRYAISDLHEAATYLKHPVLGVRLLEITNALLQLNTRDPNIIFGKPDDAKLNSSMTLFAALPAANPVFQEALDKFFDGKKDIKTLEIINSLSVI